MGLTQNKISDSEFASGTYVDLKEEGKISFEVDQEEHDIIVNSIGTDSVEITIQSDPITIILDVGESEKIDLDDDGVYDVRIKLISIENGKAKFYIRELDEVLCTEDWDCGDWGECVNDLQGRECVDLSDCGTTEDKPDEEQSCVVAGGDEPADEPVDDENTEVFDHPDISIEISIAKDSYDTGELFEGEVSVSNDGNAFDAVVLHCSYREGFDRKCSSVIKAMLGGSSSSLNAFRQTSSSYEWAVLNFYDPDTYVFETFVYNCSSVDEELGTSDCGGKDSDFDTDAILLLDPIEFASESIEVIGESLEYECEDDEECTDPCPNCESETLICVWHRCMECFIPFDCLEGYTCEDNVCVAE